MFVGDKLFIKQCNFTVVENVLRRRNYRLEFSATKSTNLYPDKLLCLTAQVLELEKWLDTDLRYLRDADPSVCTVDPDMPAKATLPQTEELPVYKVSLRCILNTYTQRPRNGVGLAM